jgi:hypothetical protein
MKNLKKILPLIPILIIGIICMLTACEKPDKPTYYKTIGIGYVYDETNNRPLKGVGIVILSTYENPWQIFGGVSSHRDTVFSDSNGYFKIRFMKSFTADTEILYYTFDIADWGPVPSGWSYKDGISSIIDIVPSAFEDKNTFSLDTLKFYKQDY